MALKALQAAKTSSPLVRQCQKTLNNTSTQHTVELYWIPGHSGVQGNEIADKLTRNGCLKFGGSEGSLGVSRQNKEKKIKSWMDNQHLARW